MLQSTTYTTLTCDHCEKTVTFLATQAGEQEALTKEENLWVRKTARRVSSLVPAEGRQEPQVYLLCSDKCEIEHAATGKHNVPEPKRIIAGAATAASVAEAAAVAKATEAATKQMKAGPQLVKG